VPGVPDLTARTVAGGAAGRPAAGGSESGRWGALGDESGPSAVAGAAGSPAAASDSGSTLEWRAPFVLDLPRTLGVHGRGRGDPAYQVTPDGYIWRTALTPEGPGTLRVAPARPGQAGSIVEPAQAAAAPEPAPVTVVRAAAWGPGAAWLLRELPGMLGADDDRAGFAPAHPLLRELSARHPGVRIGRSGRVLEALVPAVLEQKVVGAEARRAWRYLLLKFGDPAPGPAPAGMRVSPPPRTWCRIPSWEWHRAGVEGVRARTIIGAAEVAGRLEEIVTMPPADADRRLRSLPGIGVWTSAEVRQRACGDADAVSVGDYHLPSAVGWALAGRRVDDAGMLELLAPYAGHRHRAARLVELGGIRPPRRGPRMSIRDYRSF
jgi:3-methyladenine DNA glycosylase/8-oxoguanine DNA glycosylase